MIKRVLELSRENEEAATRIERLESALGLIAGPDVTPEMAKRSYDGVSMDRIYEDIAHEALQQELSPRRNDDDPVRAGCGAICGENSTLAADQVGCGEPIMPFEKIYRCNDCHVPFHRHCAVKHFNTSKAP